MKLEKFWMVFYFIVGVGIIGLWIVLIGTDNVPEFDTEPTAIVFHIIVEVLMGLMAIATAVVLFIKHRCTKETLFVTNGMIGYSVINSSGYYAENGNIAMVIVFMLLLVAIIFSSIQFLKN